MQHIKWTILSVFVITLLTGCLQDTEEFIPLEEYIETSAFGVVLDDLNLPVENATVAYEGESTITDSNGIFIFSDVVIPSSGAILVAEATGFFNTYRSLDPNADVRSVNIHMSALGRDYNFSSTAGGQITTTDDVSLKFKGGIFSRTNGDEYNGSVVANIGWVDPLHIDAYEQVPGGNFGEDEDGNEVLLEHYGTIYTQFETSSGEKLKISDGAQYQIEFPVNDQLLNQVPSEIPLWQLDKIEGVWKEYGTAQLQGDKYVAIVDEIGIWSIQLPFTHARLSGRVKTTANRPVERARIAVSREGSDIYIRSWTDAEGRFTIDYPIDQYLEVTIEDECGTSLYETSVGPLLGNHEMESFTIDPGDNYWTLTGVITECNTLSKGIEAGYGLIQTSLYRWVTPIERSGGFSTGLFNCGNYFIVIGRDIAQNMGTNPVDISDFDDKSRNYSLGVMEACR